MHLASQLNRTLIALVVLAPVLCGCTSLTNSDRTAGSSNSAPAAGRGKADVLRVGVTPTYPPLVFKRDRALTGLEVDFALALAEELGASVRFIEIPWERQIDALLNGRTDVIMAGMTITRARQVRIAFSDPYLRVGQQALVRRGEQDRYRSRQSPFWNRARVGVEAGTTGDFVVQELFHDAERVPFESPKKGARALAEGEIDAFVHDSPVVWWLASEFEQEGLTPLREVYTVENLAWGFRIEDKALRKAANDMLDAWRKSGRLQEAVRRWLPYVGEVDTSTR